MIKFGGSEGFILNNNGNLNRLVYLGFQILYHTSHFAVDYMYICMYMYT